MTWVPIDVQTDHIESLVRGDALSGVIELVWNAIDAEANEVRIVVADNELGGVSEVRIEDDGHGMTPAEAIEDFSHLGGSWKRMAERSKNDLRVLHGKEGKGRWKAFTIGDVVEWSTVANDGGRPVRTVIRATREKLGGFEVLDPEDTEDRLGTRVRVAAGQPGPTGLLGDAAPKRLSATLALNLKMYPDLRVTYRGTPLNPDALLVATSEYDLDVPNIVGDVRLTVLEWSDEVEVKRGLFLCDENGIALADLKAGIQAKGFDFTGYISWRGFREAEDRLLLAETDEVLSRVIDAARDQLRTHFSNRRDEQIRGIVQGWKNEHVYPYDAEPADEPEEIARDLFDVVAVKAASAVNASDDAIARRLSLRLLREALETSPTALRRVLSEVLQLSEASLAELDSLLARATLTDIVKASSLVARRLEFIRALEHLVFDPESKSQLKERTQLHRILASETWVFGEEFSLTADDQSLTTALREHVKHLGRTDLVETPVLDEGGHERVLDLLLARTVPQARDRTEHLVVELKAPRVTVGHEELTQIERYAFAVAADQRFEMKEVEWDFVVVSDQLSDYARQKARQSQRQPGLTHLSEDGRTRVWAKTWAEILGAAKHRHKFVQDALRYTPGAEEALAYLREVHSQYLPASVTSTE